MAMKQCVLAMLLLGCGLARGQKAADEGWSELLPPGEGRDLVVTSCNTCHNLKTVVQMRKVKAGWAKSVNDMIQRGAQLFPEEIEPITAYLTKAFGASVPKLVNVNTATREDLEKLPSLKPQIASRILEARAKAGSFKNAEELRRALGMEKTEFEKIQYFLEYKN